MYSTLESSLLPATGSSHLSLLPSSSFSSLPRVSLREDPHDVAKLRKSFVASSSLPIKLLAKTEIKGEDLLREFETDEQGKELEEIRKATARGWCRRRFAGAGEYFFFSSVLRLPTTFAKEELEQAAERKEMGSKRGGARRTGRKNAQKAALDAQIRLFAGSGVLAQFKAVPSLKEEKENLKEESKVWDQPRRIKILAPGRNSSHSSRGRAATLAPLVDRLPLFHFPTTSTSLTTWVSYPPAPNPSCRQTRTTLRDRQI